MSAVLAIGTLAGMLTGLAVDAQVGASAEVRGRSVVERNVAEPVPRQTQASTVIVPSATGILDAADLRATAAYAPRIWQNDLVERSPILTNHVLLGNVTTRHDAPWRAEGTVSATRGVMDPFSDPLRSAQLNAQNAQATTTGTVRYEELLTAAQCEVPLGDRNVFFARGGWDVTRPVSAADRPNVPLQRSATGAVALARMVTERDNLRLELTGRRVSSLTPVASHTAELLTAGLTWRRFIGQRYQGWAGATETLARSDPNDPSAWASLPGGELGLAAGVEGDALTGSAVARLTTFVDRFTSEVKPMGEGSLSVRWQLLESLAFTAGAFTGFRLDGETRMAGADARVVWNLTPRLTAEAGVLARAQRERTPGRPDFDEETVFVMMAYSSQRLLGTTLP